MIGLEKNDRQKVFDRFVSGKSSQERIRRVLAISKWLFTPIAFLFLVFALWQSRLAIKETLEQSQAQFLALSICFWMVGHLISPWFACVALTTSGAKIRYYEALDLHLRYLPARYLPGGIWHTVARVGGLRSLGIHPSHLSCFVVLENVLAAGVTLLVGGILVGIGVPTGHMQQTALLCATGSLVILLVSPIGVNRLILRSSGKLRYTNYMAAMAIVGVFWGIASASFLSFASALPSAFAINEWWRVVGAYLFSWGIGFLAIFAPQGVGVFEAVAANTLASQLSFEASAVLVAGFRLVVLLADVGMWGGWLILVVLRRKRANF